MESKEQQKYNAISLTCEQIQDELDDVPYTNLSETDAADLAAAEHSATQALHALRRISRRFNPA